jgi:hypothetical protein
LLELRERRAVRLQAHLELEWLCRLDDITNWIDFEQILCRYPSNMSSVSGSFYECDPSGPQSLRASRKLRFRHGKSDASGNFGSNQSLLKTIRRLQGDASIMTLSVSTSSSRAIVLGGNISCHELDRGPPATIEGKCEATR